MSRDLRVLKASLLAGAAYFLGVSVAHMLGVKVPGLFVYFDVPSFAYQDRIISFLAFGWAVFLFAASTDPMKQDVLVKAVLVAGAAAVAGLAIVNLTTDFSALRPGIAQSAFWLQTAGAFFYWAWLVFFAARAGILRDER